MRVALFIPLLFSSFLAVAAEKDLCGSGVYHAQVIVDSVIDGDTGRLKDGPRLRFIGINAPEMAVPEKAAEPFADQARRALEKLLAEHHQLLIRYDEEKRDHYNRLLVHAFLPDNTNIQAWMLLQGLATYVVEPPNLWQTDCYEQLEKTARKNKLGIWNTKRFQVHEADSITLNDVGFYLIQGRIKRVTSDQKAVWLHFNDLLAVRIDTKNLKRFKQFQPEGLKSQLISVRGWIYPYGSGLSMRIKHPKAMIVYD